MPKHESLASLKPDDKRVLTIIAVLGKDPSIKLLKRILLELDWRSSDNRSRLASRAGKTWVARMEKSGLLLSKPQGKVELPDSLKLQLMRDMDADLHKRSNTNAIRKILHFERSWDYESSLRLSFFAGHVPEFFDILGHSAYQYLYIDSFAAAFVSIVNLPEEQWLLSSKGELQWQLAAYLLCVGNEGLIALSSVQRLLQRMLDNTSNPAYAEACHGLMALCLLWMGRTDALAEHLSGTGSWQLAAQAIQCFLSGDDEQAQQLFKKSHTAFRRDAGRRNATLNYPVNLYYQMSLLRSAKYSDLRLLIKLQSGCPQFATSIERLLVTEAASRLLGEQARQLNITNDGERTLAHLFLGLFNRWFCIESSKGQNALLIKLADQARENDNLLLAQQLSYLTDQKPLEDSPAYLPWTQIVTPVAEWELSLKALQALTGANTADYNTPARAGASKRLVWVLDENYNLYPLEQSRTKAGNWSKGRKVAMKRLAEQAEDFPYLSDADQRLCNCIERVYESRFYYNDRIIYTLNSRTMIEAIGHPAVFWHDNLQEPVEVREQPPELLVQQQGEQLLLTLNPFPDLLYEQKISLHKRGFNQLDVTQFLPQHIEIAKILGDKGLTVPGTAREQVLQSIAAIAPLLTVQSDIGGGEDQNAELVPCDPRMHLQIQPAGAGLRMAAFFRPFGEKGPLFSPGEGGANVLGEIDGKRLRSERDLAHEKQALEKLADTSALFLAGSGSDWVFEDAQLALEALEALHTYPDELVMSWPRGKTLALAGRADSGQMQLRIKSQRDWFGLEGELRIDEDRVLSLQNLLQLVQMSGSRFVKIGESEYLALSRSLHQRVQKLGALADDKGRFHPLASSAVDEASSGMLSKSSAAWKRQTCLLAEARELQPEVPSTLAAELRDYQLEGFDWMMRLAHWGAGACLADDMGLGKTLQALALLLARAQAGPALVLAPTSVCTNWLNEASRFAPTLNTYRFGTGDRQAMLEKLGAQDVLICSYGLMQGEIERISAIEWHTLIIDEAQALKNPQSLRSKAAASLKAECRIIMTGTPIENHLGELWSLFRVINPGLLGSQKQFEQRFMQTIENGDKQAQSRLKAVVAPFILRRHKSQVLTELPPRTEINQVIEPSDKEKVFYEALRRHALEEISAASVEGQQARFKVLAQIMRLRRACCHPQLVMPDTAVASSKLKAFVSTVEELRENGHKALVFSQFVDHLQLIRQELDKHNFHYQYLDGSTPVKKRQQAVDAFQAGEGDVFLISLKAGGTGLNLTAADYVIHMDPWWNPAVEDQASDRAHRMGQQRPVTIYRFIMAGSIEEKILAMHQQKRELANSLLEGNEVASSIDVEQMLELLHESAME